MDWGRKSGFSEMDFLDNPFHILGVTTRDSKKRIFEAADEKALNVNPAVFGKARSDLLTPNNRLALEVAWLPGIAPKRAYALVDAVFKKNLVIGELANLPTLAQANLVAAVMRRLPLPLQTTGVQELFSLLAETFEKIDPEDVLRDINEDRAVAGFPEVRSKESIESEINNRRRFYIGILHDVLDSLTTESIIDVVTALLNTATDKGKKYASIIIDDLIDDIYQVEAQHFLEQESANIAAISENILGLANNKSETFILSTIETLGSMLRKWDRVAKPIQVSMMSRGLKHGLSHDLSYKVRSMAIDLANKQEFHHCAKNITEILKNIFSEVSEVSEILTEDVDILSGLIEKKKESEGEIKRFIERVSLNVEVGNFFSKRFIISPEGIQYGDIHFLWDAITHVSWGVEKNIDSLKFIIRLTDNMNFATIETTEAWVFEKSTSGLWRLVIIPLITQMLKGLVEGKNFEFGEAKIDDNGVYLVKHRFPLKNELVYKKWCDVTFTSDQKSFCMRARDDEHTHVEMSYIEVYNVHMLEAIMRKFFENTKANRLSETYNN